MPISKSKEKKVKGWARILPKVDDDLDGLIEYTNCNHSLEIYETKEEAEKYEKLQRKKDNFRHEVVSCEITYSIK